MNRIISGINNFITHQAPSPGQRFALLTNNAATTDEGTPSRVALMKSGWNIRKIFSPEHGLNAFGADGSYQAHSMDTLTQLPVISLYGDHFMPNETDLDDVDTILVDIPDAGCRFYTYLWTISYVLESCARYNKSLILLDRPNPLGGDLDTAEGPMLDEKNCSSFIGRWNIPVRHCCTLGELISYFAATRVRYEQVQVIKITNWSRTLTLLDNLWNYTPCSPALTDAETIFLYPALCFLEGINVNEGRGTPRPFTLCGAPWIHADELSSAFNKLSIPGIKSKPVNYSPTSGLYAGEKCYGVQFTLTHADSFRPVACGLQFIRLITSLYHDQCKERLYPTVANPTGNYHLDKLTGIANSYYKIKKELIGEGDCSAKEWSATIKPYLLY